MAKAKINMPEDFLLRLAKLGGRTDEILPKVLEAGGEVVEAKVRSNLKASIGKGLKMESRSTGQLASALGVSPAKQDRDGNFNVKIGFAENKNDGKSNAMIANVLEYGKYGQPPKPFMRKAGSSSKRACVAAMEAKFDEEVRRI